jgi:tetratricopeptide (TPR) repeat protein
MKIKYRILVAILIISSMIGCKDSFIELTPHNFLSSASFFKSKAEFEQGVMGVYGTLQDFYNGVGYYMGDLPSDVATKEFNNGDRGLAQAFEELDELRIPTNNLINGGWGSAFTGISRTNIVLEKLTLQDFLSESDIKQFEGELKFIRAIHYFNLVRLYGDVPLILNPVKSAEEALALYRTPKSEVYDAIIADLTAAIENLPSEYPAAQTGKATKGAAQALLGKVYHFMGQKENALQQFRAVMNSGKYDLLASYSQVFDPANKNHIESIFDIQFVSGGLNEGSVFPYQLAPLNSNSVLTFNKGGSAINAAMVPTKEFMSEIEPGDLRKDVLFRENWVDASGVTQNVPWIVKYYFPGPANDHDSPANWPYLRYADILLSVAEILNENGYSANGEAFTLLNRIRTRADLSAKTSTDLPTQEAFRLAVEQERKVELAFEGHRWWDLIRLGKAVSRITEHGQIEMANPTTYRDTNRFPCPANSYVVTNNDLVWPIPQGEIDKVPGVLTQNPGY